MKKKVILICSLLITCVIVGLLFLEPFQQDKQDSCKGTYREETIGNVYVNGTKSGEVVMRFLDINMQNFLDENYGKGKWYINGTYKNTFCD